MIDHAGYDTLLREATEYLTHLIYQLGNQWDVGYEKVDKDFEREGPLILHPLS